MTIHSYNTILCGKSISQFSSNLYVLGTRKSFCLFICLSMCRSSRIVGRILDNSQQNYRIYFSYVILNRSRKSKEKFFSQPHPTKIVKIGTFLVFLKKSKISIQVSDTSHKSLLIFLITFFDKTKIRKVTVLILNLEKSQYLNFIFQLNFTKYGKKFMTQNCLLHKCLQV